jgi:glycosyltransferase involved in cell wall biosynthesis
MAQSEDVCAILTNFNHAHYLPRSIEAILQQTVRPREFFIIDDASTDNSLEVIEQYARRDPFIQVFRNEQNLGVIETVNRYVPKARSNYIITAAADDYLLPPMIERSMSLLRQYPQAGMSTAYHTVLEERNGLLVDNRVPWNTETPRYYSPEELVQAVSPSGMASHPAIHRRDEFERVGGWRPALRWHCDWFHNLVVGFRRGIVYIPESLAVFRIAATSYSYTGTRGSEQLDVIAETLRTLLSPEYRDVLPHFQQSGVLRYFGANLLRAAARFPERYQPTMIRLVNCLPDGTVGELLDDPDDAIRDLAEVLLGPVWRQSLARDHTDVGTVAAQRDNLQVLLLEKHSELERMKEMRDLARLEIKWMRGSKFWALRDHVVGLKRRMLGLIGRPRGCRDPFACSS